MGTNDSTDLACRPRPQKKARYYVTIATQYTTELAEVLEVMQTLTEHWTAAVLARQGQS